MESGDGLASNDTMLLVRHILRLPEVSSITTGRERANSEIGPPSLAGGALPQREGGVRSARERMSPPLFLSRRQGWGQDGKGMLPPLPL
jgi:hypothetical protein